MQSSPATANSEPSSGASAPPWQSLPIIDPHSPEHAQARQFIERSASIAHDADHRRVLRKATSTYYVAVDASKRRFVDHEAARDRAASIKREAIANLPELLEQFEARVVANGGIVHWAQDADQAAAIIVGIGKRAGVRHVVKSKSMATEEIHLNEALAKAGIDPIETDLGEYICQLRDEPPYHIVTPVMHLTKGDISRTFHEKLKLPRTEVAEELTMQARDILRQRFVAATMGVTGGNFLVADVGMVAITENEGNARLSFSLPKVHVALVGIEKIVPRLEDLAILWPMLSTSGTGQHLTAYNSLIGGPRRAAEIDGPGEFHVVLLDNGRTRLLADPEQREALQCIRCGACLNVCPVYKSVGGHTYGTTYQGPIGSVITPHLKGNLTAWKHLPYASSLCGRCSEVCPVRIDIHHHLLHNRRNGVRVGANGLVERVAFKAWLWAMRKPSRYRLAGKLARAGMRLFAALRVQRWPFGNPVAGWTKSRDLPVWPSKSFREEWQERRSP